MRSDFTMTVQAYAFDSLLSKGVGQYSYWGRRHFYP